QKLYARFWKQAVLWLGRQGGVGGGVWGRPGAGSRRIPGRGGPAFQGGIRGQGGSGGAGAHLGAEGGAPGGGRAKRPRGRSASETRGLFAGTRTAGVYRIVARGHGKDSGGAKVEGEATARVIVYEEDVEMLRAAADLEFLQKLATTGGGEAYRAEDMKAFL